MIERAGFFPLLSVRNAAEGAIYTKNTSQKLSQPIPWFLYPNRGVLYIKQNVPIMAIDGSKDFGFYQPGPELRPEKVVTVTLGHPVLYYPCCPQIKYEL